MKRRVGIIGSICEKLDGQTIKTKTLLDELRKRTDWKFYIANTQNKSSSPIKLLFQTIWMLLRCKDVFILVSQNGARVYFPILYYAGKVLKTRVYHDVIGGSPEDYVINNPRNRKYLNSFVVNWVETQQMCYGLDSVGVKNAEEMPNFKRLKCVNPDDFKPCETEPYKLCTFSRVMKEKGIEDAIEAVEYINGKYKREVYQLDIYGLIDEEYKERFSSIITKCSSSVSYKGLVPYDKSVEVIRDYFALLFPTYWFGEGFPGTIVDAFSSGVPVIATDWSANKEIVEHLQTGLIYPNEDVRDLKDALIWAKDNTSILFDMKFNCVKKAKDYQPDIHIEKIIKRVERNG